MEDFVAEEILVANYFEVKNNNEDLQVGILVQDQKNRVDNIGDYNYGVVVLDSV